MSTLTYIETFTNFDKDLDVLANIYCDAFIGNNHTSKDINEAKQTIKNHSTYPGFKGVKYKSEPMETLGFAYGYTSLAGQFYQGKLEEQLDKREQNKWLQNCFEFVELAVDSKSRKRGIGKQLHDALLNQIKHDTSILTASISNMPAINLYRAKQWQIIKEDVVVIPGTEPQVIMGKELD